MSMRKDGKASEENMQAQKEKGGGQANMEETITVRMLNLPMFRRMIEAARLLRNLVIEPDKVEMEVESGSNYGRVSFETDYLCWSGRDLETFQRALSLATELVICSLEGDVFVVELSFPGVFSSYEVRGGTEDQNDNGQTERSR